MTPPPRTPSILMLALYALRTSLEAIPEFQPANEAGGWHLWMRPTPNEDPTPSLLYPQGTIAAVAGQGLTPVTSVEAQIAELGLQVELDYQQDEDEQSGLERLDLLCKLVHQVTMREEPNAFGELAYVERISRWQYFEPPDNETVVVGQLFYDLTVRTKGGDPFHV